MRIVFVGTELAELRPTSGALERGVCGWAEALEDCGYETVLHPSGPQMTRSDLASIEADAVVLNNRPLLAERLPRAMPVLHVLHNYEDAWGEGCEDTERISRALKRPSSVVAAVSNALARHVEKRFELKRAAAVATMEVDRAFFQRSWRGSSGPVLFPNRLLEKKGVRLFIETAELLSAKGLRSVLFEHTAPFAVPTTEQRELAALARAHPAVELAPPARSRQEMADWYAGASVAVCPSIRPEGLGMVALEVQAVGAPLVTSGAGGLAEATFSPNEVVMADDPVEWKEAVLRARGDGPRSGPRELVAARYSRRRAVQSMISLLSEVCAPTCREEVPAGS